jgi:transcriptional regulator with GAF, ATPase, and Fis domain
MAEPPRPPEEQWKVLKLLGQSPAMLRLREDISRYATSKDPILILGEPGTGKENVARACHVLSGRAGKPFQVAQCSAYTETLLESELFGHIKGAFTGASAQREGRFEAANQGTIFLDEVGTLAASTQVKLLRVLQEKSVERVGSNETIGIDVRVIAATNEDLDEALRAGRMRRDFYSRIAYLVIKVPPLREREEDVILLAETFLQTTLSECGKGRKVLSDGARERLLHHRWPVNVRELQAVVSRAAAKVHRDAPRIEEALIELDPRLLPSDAAQGVLAHPEEDAGGVTELVAQKTVDLLLDGKKPLEGVLKGSAETSELLTDVIEGVAEGAARYLETDPGSRLRRNGRLNVILERLGMSPRSGGKSLLASRVEAAVKERVNRTNQAE